MLIIMCQNSHDVKENHQDSDARLNVFRNKIEIISIAFFFVSRILYTCSVCARSQWTVCEKLQILRKKRQHTRELQSTI